MDGYDEAVLLTFTLLESRLERLEFILGEPRSSEGERPVTIADRIHKMEKSMHRLAGKTGLMERADEFVKQHKELLERTDEADQDSVPLGVSQKAALVAEQAPGFATLASQLKALDDQAIPSCDGFVKLAMLRPRMAQVEGRQLQQALKMSELRRRNGLVNQRYEQIMLLGMGRCWVECHEKLGRTLRTMVREEYRRRREGGDEEEEEEEEPEEQEGEEEAEQL